MLHVSHMEGKSSPTKGDAPTGGLGRPVPELSPPRGGQAAAGSGGKTMTWTQGAALEEMGTFKSNLNSYL